MGAELGGGGHSLWCTRISSSAASIASQRSSQHSRSSKWPFGACVVHTHAHAHARHARHACTHMHARTCTHMHTHARTHMHMHARALTHAHMHGHTCTHAHACTHMKTKPAHPHMHAHARAHTQACSRTKHHVAERHRSVIRTCKHRRTDTQACWPEGGYGYSMHARSHANLQYRQPMHGRLHRVRRTLSRPVVQRVRLGDRRRALVQRELLST